MWKRWKSWALPTKLTLIFAFLGLIVAVLQLIEFPRRLSEWGWPKPPLPYDVSLTASISSLHRSNVCLLSRIVEVRQDENLPEIDENEVQPLCRIDLSSLDEFSRSYTNYLAQVPYSGAESFRDFTRQLGKAEVAVNAAENVNELVHAQTRIDMSLAEVSYWMCGMEWYLRSAPEGPGPEAEPYGGVDLTRTWNEWDRKYGAGLGRSVDRRKNYQFEKAGNDCSGFINLID